MHRFGALRLRGMPRRDRHILLGLTLLSVALAVLQSVTGLSPDVLLAAPALLLLLPLLAGRYVGEDGLARLGRAVAAPAARAGRRRGSAPAARAPRVLPRGGRLIAAALAERGPPAPPPRASRPAASRPVRASATPSVPPPIRRGSSMSRLRAVAAGAALLALARRARRPGPPGQPELPLRDRRGRPERARRQAAGAEPRRPPASSTTAAARPSTVQGYQREPYARLLADGTVEVNRNSPAYYLNNDRTSTGKVPANAKPGATPELEDRRPHRALPVARPPHPLDEQRSRPSR